MKRAVLFFSAGLFSLLLLVSLAGCGDQNLAPTSDVDQMQSEAKSEVKPEVKSEVKAKAGVIQPVAAVPAPAAEEEEEEEDQFGC